MVRRLPTVLLLATLTCTGCGGETGPLDGLVDLAGQPVDHAQLLGEAHVKVMVFTRTDCPISNRYAPELNRIHDRFAPRSVAFYLVYTDASESPAKIRQHVEEYGYRMPALVDPEHVVVSRVGARVTPEAAVFDEHDVLVYRGRIDDRFVDFGKQRARPGRRDLHDAIEAVLDGRPVEVAQTRAIGCFIRGLE